ncbi:MAG: alpha/beta hydrolase [Woeseiaceae bacterium]
MRKLIYSILIASLLVLFVFNTYLYTTLPNIVFHPTNDVDVTPSDWELTFEDVTLELKNKTKIHGWYLPQPEAKKTILFFHGNGGNISHRGDSIYIFHKLKLNVLIMDYPGYGNSEGTPSEENIYQSASLAWKFLLTNKKINPKNIIIFGRSLGGVVAVDLASKVKAGGLILESTFSSIRDILKIIMPSLSNFIYLRYSMDSFNKIDKVDAPVLVIHSAEDEVIPVELGQKLFSGISSEKEFLYIEGSHNDGFMRSIRPYMQTLRRFIQPL